LPPVGPRALRPILLAMVAPALLGGIGLEWLIRRSAAPPPLYPLPAFSLVERSGRPATLASLAGHAWVADFIFTRCGGVCPAMTARMARLRRELPPGVHLASFSVDPGHDTQQVLRRYADDVKAGPEWLFVTGPQADLYALATQGFKLEAFEVPPGEAQAGGDGPFLHSSKFALVDRSGQVRSYYDSTDEGAMGRLVRDVERLEAGPATRLPALNAGLNALSALLLATGYVLIRSGRREAHRRAMLAALACSTLFLASYLVHHAHAGSVAFQGQGRARAMYFALLASHVLLAATILPLALVTLSRALGERLEAHRRIARVTLPIWAYVSVTGVVIYWLLYC
jgi:protein SCO1/2/putative membrane protein